MVGMFHGYVSHNQMVPMIFESISILWLCQNSYWKWPFMVGIFPWNMAIFHSCCMFTRPGISMESPWNPTAPLSPRLGTRHLDRTLNCHRAPGRWICWIVMSHWIGFSGKNLQEITTHDGSGWCCYINANMTGVFVDGIHGTPLI